VRESYRGCSLARPAEGVRDEVAGGIRIAVPVATGGSVGFGLNAPVVGGMPIDDWSAFERGVQSSVSAQGGTVLRFARVEGTPWAAMMLWRRPQTVERVERGRVYVRGRRYAFASCSSVPADAAAMGDVCNAVLDSLTLSTRLQDRPTSPAGPGYTWDGRDGIFARFPDGWRTQQNENAMVSRVRRLGADAPLVELGGGALEVAGSDFVAGLRSGMEQDGMQFSEWTVRSVAGGPKVDYVARVSTTTEMYVRQRVQVAPHHLCIATCAAVSDLAQSDDGFCETWLRTLRVTPSR